MVNMLIAQPFIKICYHCRYSDSDGLIDFYFAVPPTIVVSNRDQSAREGETVSMRCQVTGTPQPQVTWERLGGALPSNSDIRNNVLT